MLTEPGVRIASAAVPPARVLVRLPNWLGDLLLARPLLHALRAAVPRPEVRAVGPAPLLELVGEEGLFDHAHPWPPSSAARVTLTRSLRAWRPDAALVLPPSFSSALLAWRSGARVRIGYRGDLRRWLLTGAPSRPPRGELHLSLEYLALGSALGLKGGQVPVLVPPHSGRERAEALRQRLGLGGRYALLGPGAFYGPAKRWDAERYAALGRWLVARGLEVLVCGSGAERESCDAVARSIGTPARSLAGATDLPAQAALCAGAGIAVCNDSGLAHLSAATGCPTVVVFGSTSSAWTAPLGPRVSVVQRAPVCSPCFRRTCRIGYRCLKAVEVADVARACEEIAA